MASPGSDNITTRHSGGRRIDGCFTLGGKTRNAGLSYLQRKTRAAHRGRYHVMGENDLTALTIRCQTLPPSGRQDVVAAVRPQKRRPAASPCLTSEGRPVPCPSRSADRSQIGSNTPPAMFLWIR